MLMSLMFDQVEVGDKKKNIYYIESARANCVRVAGTHLAVYFARVWDSLQQTVFALSSSLPSVRINGCPYTNIRIQTFTYLLVLYYKKRKIMKYF